jgi:hypothetical protein
LGMFGTLMLLSRLGMFAFSAPVALIGSGILGEHRL